MSEMPSERLHALDAARGFVLLLGIAFHATLSFLPAPTPVWIVMDNSRSLTLAATFHVLHIFRMSTFFLLAGYFAHLSLHKRGLRGFVLDRLKRIGIPLVVGWPILFAAIVGVSIWAYMSTSHGGPLPKPPAYPGFPAFPLTHLWFLYVLLLLYGVTLLLRGLVVAVDRRGGLRRAIDGGLCRVVENPLGLIVLAAPTAAVLYFDPPWLAWFGIMTPDSSLVPNAGAAVGFFTAFAFGFLAHRNAGVLEAWKRRWLLNLTLSIGLSAAGLALTGLAPVLTPAPQNGATALYAACYALSIWTWTFAILGLALRFFSGHSAARRYVADASYWLYLVHLPLVMALQVAVAQLAWPWWVKFPLILAAACAVLFASYQLFVRYSFIGAILNGRRESPRRRAALREATS